MNGPWKQPEKLGKILSNVLEGKKLKSQLKRHELFEGWQELVGEALAERTSPLKIQGGELVLAVDHPVWIQELQFLKPKLLQLIQKNYPDSQIRSIRLTLKR